MLQNGPCNAREGTLLKVMRCRLLPLSILTNISLEILHSKGNLGRLIVLVQPQMIPNLFYCNKTQDEG